MLEKFDSQKHKDAINNLPFSYISLPIYLDFLGYTFKRNGEDLILWQDIIYPHDFPSIFLPKNENNWKGASISLLTEDEIKLVSEKYKVKTKVPIVTEFFYKTSDFSNPQKRKAKRVRRFKNRYEYILTEHYPKEKILDFYKKWREQKERVSNKVYNLDGEDFFLFSLDNFEKYDIKSLYVEIDGELCGFAWGLKHPIKGWASLHLKNFYQFEGLAFFLRSEMAKKFQDEELFTTGTGCKDVGIEQYKHSLKPIFTKDYYYILTE